MDKLKLTLAVSGGAIAAFLTPVLAHAQAVTIDPTDAANLNAAVGSIPTAAKGEVFAIFPVVMPYILLIITLTVAFFLVKSFMRKAH